MSVQDFIKKSILQSDNYATQSPFRIVIVLLLALLIGAFIYKVYQHFFTGVIYSRSFAMTLVGMTLLTSMVTLAISSNIVISLGMVGALSIVRYRTAVKVTKLFKNLVASNTLSSLKPCEKTVLRWLLKSL